MYNGVKARSVAAVTKNILNTNVVKVDTVADLFENVDLGISETGAVCIGSKDGNIPYRTTASIAALIHETKTKGKAKDSTENIPDSDVSNDPDIDYLISCSFFLKPTMKLFS